MGTTNQARYRINGVIDTANPVMQNIENITNSLTSWLTYDITSGKWAVVINKAGASTFSFSDSNIVGGIDVSGTGMARLFNSVEVQFPNRDLEDANDYIRLDLLPAERTANEPDLLLNLTYPLINDPVTAQQIGLQELLQARVNTTISFSTDYTASSVSAGDIISITSAAHGYTNKLYRVLKTEEVNTGGAILIKITGMEYDASVYTNDLTRVTRSNADGIITIGDIGTMSKPQITRIGGVPIGAPTASGESHHAPLPRLLIESTVPSAVYTGLVEGIEVWTYDIPDAEEWVTVTAGSFAIGAEYRILTVGDTNFTLVGATDSNIGTVFTATNAGSGTGTASTVGETVITAGSFVIGTEYKILVPGTTDFTLIGSANNTIGTMFTATGVGAGDGTASPDEDARTYKLHSVFKPSPKDVFDPDEEMDYTINSFTNKDTGYSGNFFIKLRCINSVTAGPYSERTGLIQYTPKQRTQLITDDTGWNDKELSDVCHPTELPITWIEDKSYVGVHDLCIIQQNKGLTGSNCATVQLVPCTSTFNEEIINHA